MLTRLITLLVAFTLLWSGMAAHAQGLDADGSTAQPAQVQILMGDASAIDADTQAGLLAGDELPVQNHAEHFLDIEAVPAPSMATTRSAALPDRPRSSPITAPADRYLDGLQRPPSQATLRA